MSIVNITSARYRSIFLLQDEDLLMVRSAMKQIDEYKAPIFEDFYHWMAIQPEYSSAYTKEVVSVFDRQSDRFWEHITKVEICASSVEYSSKLVLFFLQMGLPFEAYLSAVFAFNEIIEKAFVYYKVASFELMQAFKRTSSVGVFVAIDTFNNEMNKQLQEQNDMLSQLSTPVTPIWEGILLLPVVGIVDSLRAQNIMSTVLHEVAQRQTKVFILDISGVAIMDTAVANYFLKVSKAAALMGCRTILSGISPAIAQTLVELGVDTGQISTRSHMQDALEQAFKWTELKVVSA
ncbi:anti-anti-sigma regulatory factor (antagonist of anti-sigma factor) [Saprospira grandis DSM 2844]|uniref:Anti-anti-sigma regulatory factor (Antagonist of anti-sigma factor) n=1 Tax=Saprospira grandis DSM 2844 TaxID=694433 RepID=J0P5H7_9BACT|nr:STAS domain-containing protein [Saprospira grandis]EJF55114.1 anti-anti-sigma regulatory factor (antagonist of anti-sigma factor) [Saprospira grandis DSM 2844]